MDSGRLDEISKILRTHKVRQITPDTGVAKTKAAGLARGFLAYCVYMAANYDEKTSTTHLRRYRRDCRALALENDEKKVLHPNKTQGEIEAFRAALNQMRRECGYPRSGRQYWIVKRWKELRERCRMPKYHYPAAVVLRDGYRYELTPQWGDQISSDWPGSNRNRSVPCEFIRPSYGGECELEILLQLSRFRRVFEVNVSPGCSPIAYTTCSGRVRPAA